MQDAGHDETTRELVKLERKLKKVYREATEAAEEKFTKYMQDFARKEAAHKADVVSGKWTQQQFDDWRRNQLLYADTLKDIKKTLAADLQHTDKIAIQMVRDRQPDVYALNFNYGTYQVEHGIGVDTSFSLYDHDTVERLMREDPQLLPKPSARRQREIDASDQKWNMQHLTSAFTASILAGDSIPNMAKRISGVAVMDWNAAVRNARTMVTGAENAGRIDSYKRAQGMGIDLQQQWVAALDGRTRDSHRKVDGEKIRVGGKFSNGLRFPGDPEGPAREVYNCRCTLVAVVDGIDPMAFDKTEVLQRKLDNTGITYEKWKQGHMNDHNGLTFGEMRALTSYMSSGAYTINDSLRNVRKLTKKEQVFVKNLDSALKKQPVYEGNLLRTVDFRGKPEEELDDFISLFSVGNPTIFDEYISTSKSVGYNDEATVQIFIEEAKSGRDISVYNSSEDEVLYERGSCFRTKSIKFSEGKYYILLAEDPGWQRLKNNGR